MTGHSDQDGKLLPQPGLGLDPRLGIGGNSPPPEFSIDNHVAGLAARLNADHFAMMNEKVGPIAQRANDAPQAFANDEDLANAADIVTDARAARAELDGLRKKEKEPFKLGVETVDDFFRDPIKRLDRIVTVFEDRATVYTREKRRKAEAAAQAERDRLAREADEARQKAAVAAEFGDEAEANEHSEAAAQAEARIEEAAPQTAPEPVRGTTGGSARSRAEWTFEIEDFAKLDLNALRDFIAPEAVEKALKAYVKLRKATAKVEGVRFFEEEKASLRRR